MASTEIGSVDLRLLHVRGSEREFSVSADYLALSQKLLSSCSAKIGAHKMKWTIRLVEIGKYPAAQVGEFKERLPCNIFRN